MTATRAAETSPDLRASAPRERRRRSGARGGERVSAARPDPLSSLTPEARRHPRRVAAVIAAAGVALTAAAVLVTARIDHNTEQRLLDGQTRQAATVLSTAIMVIQQPLDATLAAQRASQPAGSPAAFDQVMRAQVGSGKTFQSASLWRREGADVVRVATLGDRPAMRPRDPATLAYLRRAFDAKTTTVRLVTVGDRTEIAYARADPTSDWVVYAERAIPADRRAPVDRDSAFSQIHYAIYLGARVTATALSTTDVDPRTLPLRGITSRQTVPFGDTSLILVTTPRTRLGSGLSGALPWILLVGGLLLTAIASRVGLRLTRDRQTAEHDAATITGLYERTETLYDQQRELFVSLQQALLPSANPDLPNLDVAARYVAGARGLDIGGDWFSIIELDHHRFGFVVGDVSGRGVDAVAVMARARFTIRAYLTDGDDPATVLDKCAQQFDISRDGHITTALVGVGDWRTGVLTLASAGHPPPVLVSDSGASFVDLSPGRPLGAGIAPYPPTTVTMSPGATLFCFTDGLVERRGEDIDTGLERLAGVLSAAADRPVEELVEHAVDTLRHQDAPDDIATLAIRWAGASWRVDLAADGQAPAAARRAVATALGPVLGSAATPRSDDLLLVVSELVTNAVRAGATSVGVELDASDDHVVLHVSDDAAGWPESRNPAWDDPGGRGLAIVEELADDWHTTTLATGKRVTARWLRGSSVAG